MKIHYFQHVPFEGLGNIENWIKSKGHSLSFTQFYENAALPELSAIDSLIIMGGPMGACDEDVYPWLAHEKQFISKAIKRGIKVLGICLGAQLIASALGAKVYPNAYKEIGWFPLHLTADGAASHIFAGFPAEFNAFHWHGDTFDLPAGAVHLAASEGCDNQTFLYDKNVLALQFHLDVTIESIKDLLLNGTDELVGAPYIQKASEMLARVDQLAVIEKYMSNILDRFVCL